MHDYTIKCPHCDFDEDIEEEFYKEFEDAHDNMEFFFDRACKKCTKVYFVFVEMYPTIYAQRYI